MTRVYLDYAATTMLRPEALEAMRTAWDGSCGNPSSVHREGQRARKLLEEARDSVAGSLDCAPGEIFFCSGGTEANNWALRALASSEKRHILVSSIEHPSVLQTCKALEQEGYHVSYLPVDKYGLVSPDSLAKALSPDTSLVSIMLANNEIGTIEPVKELAAVAHGHGALFHTDAVQAVGSIPVSIKELGVDALSFSGHKFGGPTGIGGLFVSPNRVRSFILGGEQERGHRAGTENLSGILGMAKALELAVAETSVNETAVDGSSEPGANASSTRLEGVRDRLISSITAAIPGAHLCGHPEKRLPGNAHFIFDGVDGEALLLYLNVEGFACSSGSACTSGSHESSHVLKAIGLSDKEARSALRISIGRENTEEEVLSIVPVLQKLVHQLRK